MLSGFRAGAIRGLLARTAARAAPEKRSASHVLRAGAAQWATVLPNLNR